MSRPRALTGKCGSGDDVHGNAFINIRLDDANCTIDKISVQYSYFSGTSGSCDALATIQVPDGVTLTSLTCRVFDTSATAGHLITDVTLRRNNLTTGAVETVFATGSTNDSGLQNISATTTTFGLVDNSNYAYILWLDYGSAVASDAVRIYGCSVAYD